MSNGQFRGFFSNFEMGIGVRVFNGVWGFLSVNDFERFEKVIEIVMKIVKFFWGELKIYIGDFVVDDVEMFVKRFFFDINIEEKVVFVKEIDFMLIGERIVNRNVFYCDIVVEIFYFNFLGSEIRMVVFRICFGFFVIVKENGEMQQYWKSFGGMLGWEMVEGIDIFYWIFLVVEKVRVLLKVSFFLLGEFQVIVDLEFMGFFIYEVFGYVVEVDFVKNGDSILVGKFGQKIVVDGFIVVDDLIFLGKFGFYIYDDEGIRVKRVEIICDGVLVNYFNDCEMVQYFGFELNGYGRVQSYVYQFFVRMGNIYVEVGDWLFEEMFEEVKYGFYMIGDKGGQVDIVNGIFIFGVREGYIIENGEFRKMVCDVVFLGKIFDVFKSICVIGKDVRIEYFGYCGKGQLVFVDDGGLYLFMKVFVGGLK